MASVTNRDRDMRDTLKGGVTSRHASGRDISGQCHALSRMSRRRLTTLASRAQAWLDTGAKGARRMTLPTTAPTTCRPPADQWRALPPYNPPHGRRRSAPGLGPDTAASHAWKGATNIQPFLGGPFAISASQEGWPKKERSEGSRRAFSSRRRRHERNCIPSR
jgi:hypothetical protein